MDDVMISHGYTTHTLAESWKCEECRQIKIDFEKFTHTGEYAEIMKNLPEPEVTNITPIQSQWRWRK